MSKEIFESQWQQIKTILKDKFENLTDEDLRHINGRYDQLIERLEHRYGYTKEQAEGELRRWLMERYPSFFASDKAYAKPIEETYRVKKEEPSSLFKWLALAGIPLLLLAGFLGYQSGRSNEAAIATQPQSVREQTVVKTEIPTDQMVISGIRNALAADKLVIPDLADIHITSSNGIVTVSGTVQTTQERDEILKVVQHVSGVRQVNDFLEVKAA